MNDRAERQPAILLPPLGSRQSLSDGVYLALRDAMTDGSLAPGTRLREVAVARQLGVSATPVREALRRLEREGLVTTTSHRGAAVAEVSPADMASLYELHEALEAFAVRRAAERGPHDLGPLRALLDEIDASLTLPEQTTFNRLDIRFHRAVNGLSGNEELARTAEQTHRRIQAARVHLDIHLPDRPVTSQAHHRAVVDAVATQDPDRAEELARLHIRTNRDTVLALLKEAVPPP